MCSTLRPRSSRRTRSPFSVSSFAAQPPEIPDPTTIASYSEACTVASLSCGREHTPRTPYGGGKRPRPACANMRRGPDVREWGCGTLDRERTLPAAPLLAHLAVPAPGASERERTHLDAIRDALRHAAEAPLLGR